MTRDFFAPRFDIRISGITTAAEITSQVLSVSYDSSLDTADMFQILLRNPDNQFTDSALLTPGHTVELHMGYGENLEPMMLGDLTSVEPRFPENGAPTIALSGYDKSHRMRHSEPLPRDFKYMNDSMIVAQIALENLLIPVVDPSPWFHVQKTQSSSDFAFIKDLAAQNFFDAYVRWDKLYFQFPRLTKVTHLEWGQNLISFSPRLSTAALAGLQIIRGYNEALAQAVIGVATGALLNLDDVVERLGPSAIELLASLGRRVIYRQTITSPIDAMGFAKAVLQDLIEGLYEGNGRCIGMPDLRAGQYIRVVGVGQRFSGRYRLRKVTHSIDGNGYITDFEITQRSGSGLLSLIRKLTDEEKVPPPDRAPKFYGVAIAKVTKAPQISPDPDPDGKLGARVKVTYPWLSDDHESAWARVVTPSASGGSGIYFMPDDGDSVIVAFQDGELSKPVVLGSVWDGALPPIYPPLPQNSVSVIKTKGGHTITLDDTSGLEQVAIKTTAGHSITLDDALAQRQVMIKTTAGHSITLDDSPALPQVAMKHANGSEVTLKSDGSISLDALTDISLTAKGSINLNATAFVNLNAGNVAVKVSGTMDVS